MVSWTPTKTRCWPPSTSTVAEYLKKPLATASS
jgi:hypothetical protein